MQNKHRNKTNVNISIYAEKPLFFVLFCFVLVCFNWSKKKHTWLDDNLPKLLKTTSVSLIAMEITIFMKFIMNNFYKLRLVFVGINFNIRQTLWHFNNAQFFGCKTTITYIDLSKMANVVYWPPFEVLIALNKLE